MPSGYFFFLLITLDITLTSLAIALCWAPSTVAPRCFPNGRNKQDLFDLCVKMSPFFRGVAVCDNRAAWCSVLAVALGSGKPLRKEGGWLLPGILQAHWGQEVPRRWDGAAEECERVKVQQDRSSRRRRVWDTSWDTSQMDEGQRDSLASERVEDERPPEDPRTLRALAGPRKLPSLPERSPAARICQLRQNGQRKLFIPCLSSFQEDRFSCSDEAAAQIPVGDVYKPC